MGCCWIDDRYVKQGPLPNALKSIKIENLNVILEQSKECICKINLGENNLGTGFLCLIPFLDKSNQLTVLITNNHILKKDDISIGKIINFDINNKNFKIKIDNSTKTYTNENYDITFIEIKKNVGLDVNKFLEIDYEIFEDNLYQKYKKQTIYIIHYGDGEIKFSNGLIKSIGINNLIEHTCETSMGSSGSPIINYINNKVIGVHKGAKKKCNLGTLLRLPIQNFYKEYELNLKKEKEKLNIENKKEEKKNDSINFPLNNEEKLKENNNIIKINSNIKNINNEDEKEINHIISNNENYHNNNNINNKEDDVDDDNFYLFNDNNERNVNFINNNMNNNSNNKNNINNDNININNYSNNENNENQISNNNINNNYHNENQISNSNNSHKENNENQISNNNNSHNENEDNGKDFITIIYSKLNINKSKFSNFIFKFTSKEKFSENKLFGETFVKNNANNCKIIINGKEFNLSSSIESEYNNSVETIEIKLKGINKVIDMTNMFIGCLSLCAVPDIDKLDTSKVVSMSNMFCGCKYLLSLPDISVWDTHNVVNMGHMFQYCCLLSSLPDISKWNTNKVNNLCYMFCACESLSYIPDISKWNTRKVKYMGCMFSGCTKLVFLPEISEWDTSNVVDMSFMFSDCKSLQYLSDISKWDTSNVQDMRYMFHNCSSINSLPDLNKWNTSSLKEASWMFLGCNNINIPQKFKDCIIF